MATQQDIQDYLTYADALNADGGRGTMARAQAVINRLAGTPAGKARMQQLAADPTVIKYIQDNSSQGGGFLGGLVEGIGNFASQAGVKEGLILAGLATGADTLGLFGGSAGGASTIGTGAMATTGSAAETLASMTGAGTGVSDFAALNSAMSAPGAMVSGSLGNAAIGLGYDMLGTAATGAGVVGGTTALQTILQQAAQAGVSPEVLQQAATNPSVLEQVKQVVAGTGTGTGASWMDYLSTGLGLAQGVTQLTGGNNLDANQVRNMIDPFAPYRSQYAQQLNSLMSNPSSVTTLPGYQFLQQQGQQGVQRALAAQGRTVSGQELLALQEQDQGLANKFYNDQYSKLAQLSGASANPSSGGSAAANAMSSNLANQQAGWNNLGTLAAGAVTPNNPVNRTVGGIADILGFR